MNCRVMDTHVFLCCTCVIFRAISVVASEFSFTNFHFIFFSGNNCYFRKGVCENPSLKKAHSGRCLESAVRSVLGSDHERVVIPPIHRAAVRPLHTRVGQQASNVMQEKTSKRVYKRLYCCPFAYCKYNCFCCLP